MEPIHKFNGGIGATLCHKCSVIIHEGFTDDLYCEKHGGKPKFNYKLIRERDGLIKYGNVISLNNLLKFNKINEHNIYMFKFTASFSRQGK